MTLQNSGQTDRESLTASYSRSTPHPVSCSDPLNVLAQMHRYIGFECMLGLNRIEAHM